MDSDGNVIYSEICVGLKDAPFFMVKNDSGGTAWTGNDRFYGFNVDIIRALSAKLNFRYELYAVSEQDSATVPDRVVRELVDGVSML